MISIIIPVYNEEKLIGQTIRQFEHLHLPHEVIVSDTQSTDRTMAIARKYADRVITLDPSRKRGVSTGRNDGAAAARENTEFFVFLDCGGMIPNPDAFFGAALSRFEHDPRLIAISTRIEVERSAATWSDRAVSWIMNAYFWFFNRYFGGGYASGKFQMIRRSAFMASGGFNEKLTTAEDIDLFGRLRKFGRVRIMWNLAIYHNGRRFHAKGAWRTLGLWIWNSIWFFLTRKPSDKWEPVR